MGQCPVSLPTEYSDDASSLPASKGSYVGSSLSASLSLEEQEQSFLVPHRPEGQGKCILDPGEVDRVRGEQGFELERREVELMGGNIRDPQTNSMDDAMTDITFANSAAPSLALSLALTDITKTDVTTGTDVTRLVKNFDRYATKRRGRAAPRRLGGSLSSMGKIQEETQLLDNNDSSRGVGDGGTPRALPSPGGFIGKYHSQDGTNNPEDNGISLTQKEGQAGGQHSNGRCGSGLLPTCATSSLLSRQQQQQQKTKNKFDNILHLKMKPYLIDFYQNQYLLLFPDSPRPPGIKPTPSPVSAKVRWRSNLSSKQNALREQSSTPPPNLVRTSSDSSSSSPSHNIIFGFTSPSSTVYLSHDDTPFLDLAITGSLGLIERPRTEGSSSPELSGGSGTVTLPSAKSHGTPTPEAAHQKNPHHYLILVNRRSGVPLAVCALKSPHGSPVVRIYVTKPRVPRQKPAACTADLGLAPPSLPLYGWAEFVMEGDFPQPVRYLVYMSAGSQGKFEKDPSYRGSHATMGSPASEIRIVGRTGSEKTYTGCCVVSLQAGGDEGRCKEPYFSMSISRGVDPALFICLTAIIDETMEHTMKMQCDAHARKLVRRVKATNAGGRS